MTAASQDTVEDDDAEARIAALEAFVVGNHDLEELEQLIAGFNLFEALGNTRREERHSDFLAFLLDPRGAHGLDDRFLRAFVQQVVDAEAQTPSPLRKIDVALFDLAEARVEREWNCIDVMVTVPAERFVLLIENKVDTDEGREQLARYFDLTAARYPGWSILAVFLTRDGHDPSHAAYHPISYSDVHAILRPLHARLHGSWAPDIEVVIRHYIEMLERHIMDDTRVVELARKIYSRHGRALDIIFEHRPDAQDVIRDEIRAAVEAHPDLRVVDGSKASFQFVPTGWDASPALKTGGDGTWRKTSELLRFEFKNAGTLSLHLILGPGDDALRIRLHGATGEPDHKRLFRHRTGKLYGKWTQLWRMSVLTRGDDADLSMEDKIATFRETWRTFCEGPLPKLTAAVIEVVADDNTG